MVITLVKFNVKIIIYSKEVNGNIVLMLNAEKYRQIELQYVKPCDSHYKKQVRFLESQKAGEYKSCALFIYFIVEFPL